MTLQTFKKEDLKFMHLKVRGLHSKIEELQITLKERNVDICSLNETFLKSKKKVDIPGYHLVRKDRSTGKGGGVAFSSQTRHQI